LFILESIEPSPLETTIPLIISAVGGDTFPDQVVLTGNGQKYSTL
jgi:hypothetical protein